MNYLGNNISTENLIKALDTNLYFYGSVNNLKEIKNPKVGDVVTIASENCTYLYAENKWELLTRDEENNTKIRPRFLTSNCKCCGAVVDINRENCEYCGAAYEIEYIKEEKL